MELKLKKNQEITNIDIKKAENGGFCVCLGLRVNGKTHMEDEWENKDYVFSQDQEQEAFDFLVTAFKQKMSSK